MNVEEADAISGKLGLTREQFVADYTDRRWPGTQSFLMKHVDGACIFLKYRPKKNIHLCTIHDFKPGSCRAWASGTYQRECQQSLRDTWQLTVDPSGRIYGSSENIAAFQSFLQSLKD